MFVLAARPPHPHAAALLVEFMLSRKGQDHLPSNSLARPPRTRHRRHRRSRQPRDLSAGRREMGRAI
jgi:ABC-type Fe3+ transport system substrate-binding protein